MLIQRRRLTPQMLDYEDLVDRGEMPWMPYLMYFHRRGYRSATVNTDRLGFRFSTGPDGPISAGSDGAVPGKVNLLVGSSTALGIGTTSDAGTIPSKLTEFAPDVPWLNFGGCGYCTTQEFLLFSLHRQLLGGIGEIVLLTGLNDLGLTGLPASARGDYGGFFFSGDFYAKMDELKRAYRKRGSLRRRSAPDPVPETVPGPEERVSLACAQIALSLDNWRVMADAYGARLSFVMQPLATWVRSRRTAEEAALFNELDTRGPDFWKLFGPVAGEDVGRSYAEGLAKICADRSIRFFDLNLALAEAVPGDEWLFVERAHFHDAGYATAAEIIAEAFRFH